MSSVGFLYCSKILSTFALNKYKNIMTKTKEMTRPNIRLLADRVLVRVLKEAEFKTASGLIMPPSPNQNAKTEQGEVLRVSKRIENLDTSENIEDGWDKIEEGDIVLYSSFAGSEVLYKGYTYKILRITDIFGVIE